ncbi:MAG TPA: GNAT family N-acetyltransferase [Candidatus Methylacidiphilales bacterium]|nr:GNAT family N-acetyltransferase [Candidatus Methylacidiphilales bacterium]
MTANLPLYDGEIELRLVRETPADPSKDWLRALHYHITLRGAPASEIIGEVDLRLGYTTNLVRYGGHFGYGIRRERRGHHYAGKACKLLKQTAIAHGMDVVWITCNPDNWPSRKTCEWLGATLVEIVDLPKDNDQYIEGERQKCRYRWILY